MANRSYNFKKKETARLQNSENVVWTCKSKCCVCQSDCHNKGYSVDDGHHKICRLHNKEHGYCCKCFRTIHNLTLTEKMKPKLTIQDFLIRCEKENSVCPIHGRSSIAKSLECNHRLCSRCISEMLFYQKQNRTGLDGKDDMLQCRVQPCHTEYPKSIIRKFLQDVDSIGKKDQTKIYINNGNCYCDNCFREKYTCQLECNHVYCLLCLLMLKQQQSLQLYCNGNWVNVCFCTKNRCNRWMLQDDVDKIIVESCHKEKDCIKTPDNRTICYAEFCHSPSAIQLPCKHTFCAECVNSLIQDEDPSTSRFNGEKVSKCPWQWCNKLVWIDFVKDFWEEKEKNLMYDQIEITTDCCYGCFDDKKKIGELKCGHIFCTDCLERHLESQALLSLFYKTKQESVKCRYKYGCTTYIPIKSIKHFLSPKSEDVVPERKDSLGRPLEDPSRIQAKNMSISDTEARDSFDYRHDMTGPSELQAMKGLVNSGFSCYANCIFQILSQTPGFLQLLETFLKRREDLLEPSLLYNIMKYINGVNYGSYWVSRTECEDCISSLMDIVYETEKSFGYYVQNDSHSFLMHLFNLINTNPDGPSGENGLLSMFEGQLKTYFRYDECGHTEDTIQMFRSLNVLPFSPQDKGNVYSVKQGLKRLMAEETFDQKELPCRICNVPREGTGYYTRKVMFISKSPDVLILQIGRGEERCYDIRGTNTVLLRKNCNLVKYPKELSLKELNIVEESEDAKYHLYGVVLHWGTLRGGHYTAFVKNRESQEWFLCNDLSVRLVAAESIEDDPDAYLLFYEKKLS